MLDIFKEIDLLQSQNNHYFIDIFPKKIESSNFFELEEYLLNTYIYDFAKKISLIAIKLMYYFPVQIYITELPNSKIDKYKNLIDIDLKEMPLSQLEQIITDIIVNDFSSIQFLFGNQNYTLLSINGNFSVDIYNIAAENLKLITTLVNQENLFLRKCNYN